MIKICKENIGELGPKGPVGDKGDKGDVGPQGDKGEAGPSVDTNFANTDLTFTADRTHNLSSKDLLIQEVNGLNNISIKTNFTGSNSSYELSDNGNTDSRITAYHVGSNSGTIEIGYRGRFEASGTKYGNKEDGFIYATGDTNGFNIISDVTTGQKNNYIRLQKIGLSSYYSYLGYSFNGTLCN